MKTTLILASLLLLVLLGIGCERKVTNEITNVDPSVIGADACMECHNDTDGILQQAEGEWLNSTHASGLSVDYTNRRNSNCSRCHDHQGFLYYVANGTSQTDSLAYVSAIHCFTCHSPHTSGDFTLRATGPVTLVNGQTYNFGPSNLCANCHQSRTSSGTIVDNQIINSRFGPHHSNQSDMIIGTNGYEYAGFTYQRTTHNALIAKVCVTCHMGHPQEHGGYDLGGHSFDMRVDHEGEVTTISKNCQLGVAAGCHPMLDSRNFYPDYDWPALQDHDGDGTIEDVRKEFADLLAELEAELVSAGYISGTTFAPVNDTIANAGEAGAVWNYVFCKEDQSQGSHNLEYAAGLLRSSRNYMRTGDPNDPGLGTPSRRPGELLTSH